MYLPLPERVTDGPGRFLRPFEVGSIAARTDMSRERAMMRFVGVAWVADCDRYPPGGTGGTCDPETRSCAP